MIYVNFIIIISIQEDVESDESYCEEKSMVYILESGN